MEAALSRHLAVRFYSILSFHSPITRMPDVDVGAHSWTGFGLNGRIPNIKTATVFFSNFNSLSCPLQHTTSITTKTMVTSYEIPKSPSSQLKTVLDYLDLVKVLNLDEVEKLFTDDFVQSTFPSSLNVPPRTKQEDLEFLRGLSEQLQGRHLQVRYHRSLAPRLSSPLASRRFNRPNLN